MNKPNGEDYFSGFIYLLSFKTEAKKQQKSWNPKGFIYGSYCTRELLSPREEEELP